MLFCCNLDRLQVYSNSRREYMIFDQKNRKELVNAICVILQNIYYILIQKVIFDLFNHRIFNNFLRLNILKITIRKSGLKYKDHNLICVCNFELRTLIRNSKSIGTTISDEKYLTNIFTLE